MVRQNHHNDSGFRTRVAVYARFSCDKQRDASIEDQIYEAERYCERHNYEIVKVYPDYAMSGRSDDRPQFLSMIEDAKAGAFDVVLVWKMDRFARNMQDQFYHEKILADCGVRLESVKEHIAGTGIEASMNKGLHAMFAQIRSQQSAEDTMRGMIGKARKCQYLGYQWLGYTHNGDEIVLDPATAPLAFEVHDRYLKGDAVKDIVDYLNDRGVTGRNGKPVGYSFVAGILKNWAYAGVYTWGKQKDAQGNVILDADGLPIPLVRVPDGIPAIVTKKQKELCLQRLRFKKHVNGKTDFLLSGKLFCPECHNPMHGETCTDKYGVKRFRYVCMGKRKACNGVYWQETIEPIVARTIRAMLADPEKLDYIAERFVANRSNRKPYAAIEAAQADLKTIAKQRENLIQAVEDGMPYKHVKEKLEKLDAQQAGIERKLDDLNHAKREITKTKVLQALTWIANGAQTDEEILRAFVSKIWVFQDHAMAEIRILDDDGTPQEIACVYENTRNRRSFTVSSDLSLVPPSDNKTKRAPVVTYIAESMPVILFESSVCVLFSLKAA